MSKYSREDIEKLGDPTAIMPTDLGTTIMRGIAESAVEVFKDMDEEIQTKEKEKYALRGAMYILIKYVDDYLLGQSTHTLNRMRIAKEYAHSVLNGVSLEQAAKNAIESSKDMDGKVTETIEFVGDEESELSVEDLLRNALGIKEENPDVTVKSEDEIWKSEDEIWDKLSNDEISLNVCNFNSDCGSRLGEDCDGDCYEVEKYAHKKWEAQFK